MTIDPTQVSFSQAQGLAPLPQPLKLGELDRRARVRIWNAFYDTFVNPNVDEDLYEEEWDELISSLHIDFFEQPKDEAPKVFWRDSYLRGFKAYFEMRSFNEIFDLLTFLMRHQVCPDAFAPRLKDAFAICQVAYAIATQGIPTIYPATTPEEGEEIIVAVQQLNDYGLDGARQHLMQSSDFINQGEWARSVHESISAVESVARQIAPGSNTLGAALNQLRRDGLLEHRALEQGLGNLYGYTSDEQGVRHSLLDQGQSNVGQDEAVFMLGACASFASYLWRKHLGATQE